MALYDDLDIKPASTWMQQSLAVKQKQLINATKKSSTVSFFY